jgi:hypothetical protein
MKRIINSENYRFERHSSSSPVNTSINNNNNNENKIDTTKYRVSRSREKIKLTQKYRILNAFDPHTGIVYSLKQIVSMKLINKYTSCFCLPSTGQFIALDEAIQLGYVKAELIDEFLETSNESYEFVQPNENITIPNEQEQQKQIIDQKEEEEEESIRIDNNNLIKTSLSSINTIIKVVTSKNKNTY